MADEIRSWTVGGATTWQTGGRVTVDPSGSTMQVSISGGTYARRLDAHHGSLLCGECHQIVELTRDDGQPISDDDIVKQLSIGVVHDCPAAQAPVADHAFTPGRFNPDQCRVMLARYPCHYLRSQHHPGPPEDIDHYGYRRQPDHSQTPNETVPQEQP